MKRCILLLAAQLTLVGAEHIYCLWDSATDGTDSNSCHLAGDGDCDDGGPGAEYGLCAIGSDSTDCGSRAGRRLNEATRSKFAFLNGLSKAPSNSSRASNSRQLAGDYTAGASCALTNMYVGSCGLTFKKTKCWEGDTCCTHTEDACCEDDWSTRIGIIAGAGAFLLCIIVAIVVCAIFAPFCKCCPCNKAKKRSVAPTA